MIRRTLASNCSRLMFDLNSGASIARRRHRGRAGVRGTGPRRRSRRSASVRRRPRVGRVHVRLRVQERVGQQGQLMAHVVEDDQHVAHHQRHVREADRVGIRLAQRLHRANQVVAEEPDRAARERRQVVDRRQPVAAEVVADRRVGVGGTVAGARLGAGGRIARPLAEHAVLPAKHRAGAEAEKGVAAEASLLGGLEQEAGALGAQLEEGRDRGLAVVDERQANRDRVSLASQLARPLDARVEVELGLSADRHGADVRVRSAQRRRPFSVSSTDAIEIPRETRSTCRW